MNKYIPIIVVALVVTVAGLWVTSTRVMSPWVENTCTPAAMICSDGSVVGRGGPNCEFDACPVGVIATTSGVGGVVKIGSSCPEHAPANDPVCADKPYAAPIAIFHKGEQKPFIVGSSNTQGIFEFLIPPGTYTLTAGEGNALPYCPLVEVTVQAGRYTSTTISCDSGIR